MDQIEMYRNIFDRPEPLKPEHEIMMNATISDEIREKIIENGLISAIHTARRELPDFFRAICTIMEAEPKASSILIWVAHIFYGYGYVTGREHEKYIRELENGE